MFPRPAAAPLPRDGRARPLSVSGYTLIFAGILRKDGKSLHRTTLTLVSPSKVRAAHTRPRAFSTRADQCARIFGVLLLFILLRT